MTRRAFSVLEVLLACSIAALLLGSALIAVKGQWNDIDPLWAPRATDSLNLGMDKYRAYRLRGYTPLTPWSATDANGVLAELAKPLVKDGVQIVVMTQAPQMPITSLKITPSTFGPDAKWSYVP